MPLCDQTGTPAMPFDGFFHFRSSIIAGSASKISARMRASVASRQSLSAGLLCFFVIVQSSSAVRRLFVVYGSTNKYRPLKSNNASGSSGEYVTHGGGVPCVIATKLAMTVNVKAMDSQRWV